VLLPWWCFCFASGPQQWIQLAMDWNLKMWNKLNLPSLKLFFSGIFDCKRKKEKSVTRWRENESGENFPEWDLANRRPGLSGYIKPFIGVQNSRISRYGRKRVMLCVQTQTSPWNLFLLHVSIIAALPDPSGGHLIKTQKKKAQSPWASNNSSSWPPASFLALQSIFIIDQKIQIRPCSYFPVWKSPVVSHCTQDKNLNSQCNPQDAHCKSWPCPNSVQSSTYPLPYSPVSSSSPRGVHFSLISTSELLVPSQLPVSNLKGLWNPTKVGVPPAQHLHYLLQ
jgi:hypothetical protein